MTRSTVSGLLISLAPRHAAAWSLGSLERMVGTLVPWSAFDGWSTKMVTNVPTRLLGDRLDDLLDQVAVGDEIVLEREGQPHAALITAADYEEFRRLRAEEQRRRTAGERLEALRTRVRARNQDLTQEEAEALADRAARDAIESLAERGAIAFERDRSSTER